MTDELRVALIESATALLKCCYDNNHKIDRLYEDAVEFLHRQFQAANNPLCDKDATKVPDGSYTASFPVPPDGWWSAVTGMPSGCDKHEQFKEAWAKVAAEELRRKELEKQLTAVVADAAVSINTNALDRTLLGDAVCDAIERFYGNTADVPAVVPATKPEQRRVSQ